MKYDLEKEYRYRNNYWKNQDKEEKYLKYR